MRSSTSFLALLLMFSTLPFISTLQADDGLGEKIQQAQRDQKSKKLTNALVDLGQAAGQRSARSSTRARVISNNGLVAVEILFSGVVSAAIDVLSNAGMKDIVATPTVISGYMPVEQLSSLEQYQFVKTVRHNRVFTRAGLVTSEGVQGTNSTDIAALFNVTGSGVRVGVISDSYDCLGGEQADIASGDIPEGVQVVSELVDCSDGSDEGRALIQIVYDFATEAEFVFGTGITPGEAAVAELIKTMVDTYEVDVIVDDTASLLDLFFQEGAVSVAINDVVSQGVSYVVSAGNSSDYSYEELFSEAYDARLDLKAHDFDPSEGVSIFQKLTIPTGELFELVLQWDEPAYSISGGTGAESDLDIFLLSRDGSVVYESAASNNLGSDPIELLTFYNDESSQETEFHLLIVHAQGRSPGLVKYIIPSKFTGSIDEYYTGGSTIVGRSNVDGAISVGASPYERTIAFGHSTNEVQFFSSVGGVPILFDSAGERIADEFRVSRKPDLTAPDGINTTFFGGDSSDSDSDNDGFPNFLGTSAAAPHVAGIIALMLEAAPGLAPAQIQHILQATSTDIVYTDGEDLPVGFDFTSGYGLANGASAVSAAIAWPVDEPAPLPANFSYDLFDDIQPLVTGLYGGEQSPGSVIAVGGSVGLETLLSLLFIYFVVIVRKVARLCRRIP